MLDKSMALKGGSTVNIKNSNYKNKSVSQFPTNWHWEAKVNGQ